MTSKSRLQTVVLDATLTLDERYDGYRSDVARALSDALRAQIDSPTDAARAREIDKRIEWLGNQLRNKVAG